MQRVLDAADSLKLDLTKDQRTNLTSIATHYSTTVDSIGNVVTIMLSANGGRPDLGAMAPRFQQVNIVIVNALQQSIKDAEAALSPPQWAKVPDRIKFPLGQPAPPPRK